MKRIINQKEYEFSQEDIAIEKLRFWPENPRIHTDVYSIYASAKDVDYDAPQLQEKIYQKLTNRENVRKLRSQLEANGGLVEPLIVRKSPRGNYYDVIEGNRRLAACKMNHEKSDHQKFTHLTCEIISDDIFDGDVLSLLSTLHITGKIEWSPFTTASFIRRYVEEYKSNNLGEEEAKKQLQKELQVSPQKIEKALLTIGLMENAGEIEETKFSYYDVLCTNKHIKKIIVGEQNIQDPESRSSTKVLVGAIKEWEGKATDFRDAINDVFDDSKAKKKFLGGKMDLVDAAEIAHSSGSTDSTIKKVERFRKSIENKKSNILSLDPTDALYKKMIFEFNKLQTTAKKIHDALKKKVD